MAATKTDFSTPDIPQSQAVFYVSARTIINAPASLVFRTLRNSETWKDWNRWSSRVIITDQPDEEDDATLLEIQELVRNTSIAVNMDSDITDGAAAGKNRDHSGAYWRASMDGPVTPSLSESGNERPSSIHAVTRQRLASNARRLSEISAEGPSRTNSTTNTNGEKPKGLSGAQLFQASTDSRRGSLKSSTISPPGSPNQNPNGNGVYLSAPNDSSLLMAAPPNTASTRIARRTSTATAKNKRQLHINAIYGEPSVRIQLGTKMTLYMKMKLPSSPEVTERSVVVTEVSRPDDPTENDMSPAQLASAVIMRTKTHTDSISGVYRLVWTSTNSYNPPRSYPRFLLQTQRVHEIRPTVDGAGQEICEYWDWECQKGMMAKKTAKSATGKKYLEERMAEWGRRLGDFCESMGGAVERRDFVSRT